MWVNRDKVAQARRCRDSYEDSLGVMAEQRGSLAFQMGGWRPVETNGWQTVMHTGQSRV